MKKLILLLILFIPFLVLAEDCDISKITISSIEQVDINGNTKVISEPTIDGKSISLDLKMYEVGDSITYDLVLNNASDEDYMIDENTFKSDSDYIEYILSTSDNSNVVKANSSKNMTLIVSYKNEVDNSLLTNNKYNASNKLSFSMNTIEEPKEIEEISTDPVAPIIDKPIIQKVKNPITSSVGFKLLIVILLTTIVIILLTVINKKQYNKYFILLSIIYLIPTIYAVCTCNIEVESTIEIEKIRRLFDTVVDLANEQNACFTKYTGQVTDQVGETVQAENVYFNKCADKRNIIFNNMCWQMIRTTETGGIKIIYNGDVVDGKCESTRGTHKGIVRATGSTQTLNAEYLYGDSFTYDTTNNTFTLTDTIIATWSDSTYENLLGKFTCKNTNGTCTKLYNVNGYESNTTAYTSAYTISDTNYALIGTSSFNANGYSPAMVGYMFNKVYNYKKETPGTNTYKFGNAFTYDTSTNTYTLSGTTQDISDWSTGYNTINNTHYTCWNESGSCSTISFIYSTSTTVANYFDISDGKDEKDILDEMLVSSDVNKYNSSIKGIIDAWYTQNMLSKTNMLEDTVYCNARNISSYGGWNPDGGNTASNYNLKFKNYISKTNLACPNETDQFAVSNNKAKLKYPVALIQDEERNNIGDISLMATGVTWWSFSPHYFGAINAFMRYVLSSGDSSDYYVRASSGIRVVVSLSSDIVISEGDGSEESPWIIER